LPRTYRCRLVGRRR